MIKPRPTPGVMELLPRDQLAFQRMLAVIRRTRAGRNPFAPDKQHLHHRLLEMGHSQVRAVLLMYAWTAVVAGAAVALAFIPVANQLPHGKALELYISPPALCRQNRQVLHLGSPRRQG